MLTRRDFLKISAGSLLAGSTLDAVSADKQVEQGLAGARPSEPAAISGTLWWCSPSQFSEWGLTGWRKELEQQQALGFDLLWLTQAPQVVRNPGFSLRNLLDLCAERKFQVILDTGSTGKWFAPLDLKKELDLCRKNIRTIGEQLAGHPAFYAWYIPHEIYMDWGAMNEYVSDLYPALVEACRKSAKLPVTLSPFFILDRTRVFGDFRYNEPAEYGAYWAGLIKKSGLDIIMLQDSGEHFSYVTNEQRRPFFQAMSQACRLCGARLWGNVEVAEMDCPSIEAYVSRYGRVHHSAAKGIPWRPVPLDRLREKLKLAAEYSERLVSWGYQEFCRPALGRSAASWYTNYQRYREKRMPGKVTLQLDEK